MSEQKRGPIQDVNIALGDDLSSMLYEASRQTFNNRPGLVDEQFAGFAGFRAMHLNRFYGVEDLCVNLDSDGVGTKVEISERLGDHSAVAHDLFAMICDDAGTRGAEPIAVTSVLDVRQLNDDEYTRSAVRQLCAGYISAAKAAGVVVVNGETAELGDRVGGYGDFNYNWAGTTMWLAHPSRILTGAKVRPGHTLVGFTEPGFRSNGITGVRKAFGEALGPDWHDRVIPGLGELSLGKQLQRPSTIYTRLVTQLTGGYDIRREPAADISGIAHITGGGQPSKLGRMLKPSGLGAVITDPIDPPAIMRYAQEIRGFSDEDAYRSWHMGPGMIVATPDPDNVIREALAYGISAQEIGEVTARPGIHIENRDAAGGAKRLSF